MGCWRGGQGCVQQATCSVVFEGVCLAKSRSCLAITSHHCRTNRPTWKAVMLTAECANGPGTPVQLQCYLLHEDGRVGGSRQGPAGSLCQGCQECRHGCQPHRLWAALRQERFPIHKVSFWCSLSHCNAVQSSCCMSCSAVACDSPSHKRFLSCLWHLLRSYVSILHFCRIIISLQGCIVSTDLVQKGLPGNMEAVPAPQLSLILLALKVQVHMQASIRVPCSSLSSI